MFGICLGNLNMCSICLGHVWDVCQEMFGVCSRFLSGCFRHICWSKSPLTEACAGGRVRTVTWDAGVYEGAMASQEKSCRGTLCMQVELDEYRIDNVIYQYAEPICPANFQQIQYYRKRESRISYFELLLHVSV